MRVGSLFMVEVIASIAAEDSEVGIIAWGPGVDMLLGTVVGTFGVYF
jgi:hypothetical protein